MAIILGLLVLLRGLLALGMMKRSELVLIYLGLVLVV
jgi:hypothetical protein